MQSKLQNTRFRAARIESLEPRRLMAVGDVDSTFSGGDATPGYYLGSSSGQFSSAIIQSSGRIIAASRSHGFSAFDSSGNPVSSSFPSQITHPSSAEESDIIGLTEMPSDHSILYIANAELNGDSLVQRYSADGATIGEPYLSSNFITGVIPVPGTSGAPDRVLIVTKYPNLKLKMFTLTSSGLVPSNTLANGASELTFESFGGVIRDTQTGDLYFTGSESGQPFLAKYSSDGSPNLSYGTNGKVNIPYSGSLTLDSNRTFILMSSSQDFTIRLTRLKLNGEVDTSFGTSGTLIVRQGDTNLRVSSPVIDAQGHLYFQGNYNYYKGTETDFYAINPNGTFDQALNADGRKKILVDGDEDTYFEVEQMLLDGNNPLLVGSFVKRRIPYGGGFATYTYKPALIRLQGDTTPTDRPTDPGAEEPNNPDPQTPTPTPTATPFGAGTNGRPITITGSAGESVRISLIGPGRGEVEVTNDGLQITLTDTTAASRLTLVSAASSFQIASISGASVQSIVAPRGRLNGLLNLSGSLNLLRLAGASGTIQVYGSAGPLALLLGEARELDLYAPESAISKLIVKSWIDDDGDNERDQISAKSIASAVSLGNFGADLTLSDANAIRALGSFKSRGTLYNAKFTISGPSGPIIFNGVDNSTLSVNHSSTPNVLVLGSVRNSLIESAAVIRTLSVTDWQTDIGDYSAIIATGIQSLVSKGDFNAKIELSGTAGRTLGAMVVRGTFKNRLEVIGDVGAIMFGGCTQASISIDNSSSPFKANLGVANKMGIDSDAPIASLITRGWINASPSDFDFSLLSAPWVGTMVNRGDFKVHAKFTDATAPFSVKSLVVSGAVTDSFLTAASNIGKVVVGSTSQSRFTAGVTGNNATPFADIGFARDASIASFVVTGTSPFADTILSASNIGVVSLRNVTADNADEKFGVVAKSLKSYLRRPTGAAKVALRDPGAGDSDVNDDYLVRIV